MHCQYLSRNQAPSAGSPRRFATIRCAKGKDCIGPFLEDLTTDCGLWEPHPDAHLIPLPQPERWQRRRRREGFDLTQRGDCREDWR